MFHEDTPQLGGRGTGFDSVQVHAGVCTHTRRHVAVCVSDGGGSLGIGARWLARWFGNICYQLFCKAAQMGRLSALCSVEAFVLTTAPRTPGLSDILEGHCRLRERNEAAQSTVIDPSFSSTLLRLVFVVCARFKYWTKGRAWTTRVLLETQITMRLSAHGGNSHAYVQAYRYV